MAKIQHRVELAGDSLKGLVAALHNGPDFGQVAIFGAVIDQTTGLITRALALPGADPENAVKTLAGEVVRDLLFPKDVIFKVIEAAVKGKVWAWGGLPGGLPIGKLHAWLNDPSTYQLLTYQSDGTAVTAADKTLERQFRARLLAAADTYLRGRAPTVGGSAALTRSDERVSAGVVGEVVCVFLDAVLMFVFEPDCYPTADLEWDGFEDIGGRLAALTARQVRASIRSTIGLLFRGVWAWSLMNEVLVELAASVFGSLFSTLLEGVLRNLAWTFQVVSVYPGGGANPPPGVVVVDNWPSLEAVPGTAGTLQYVALLRRPAGLPVPDLTRSPLVKAFLRDIGAYADVCYLQYKFDSRFPTTGAADTVTVTEASLNGGTLRVRAATTAAYDWPRPVLRAYFCCHMAVMQAGATPADAYELTIDIDSAPPPVLRGHGLVEPRRDRDVPRHPPLTRSHRRPTCLPTLPPLRPASSTKRG